jgi:2-C-methyl-D-erythritol 4-phosphate cytidylyltransferase
MKTTCILLAAGKGLRFGSELPKQFIKFNDVPVIIHTLNVLDSCERIDNIIIVMNPSYINYMERLLKKYPINKPLKIIKGGETRQESTYNGIKVIEANGGSDIVVIHEGVRPFIDEELVNSTIEAAKEYGAVDVGVKTTDTMVQVKDGLIVSMPDRTTLYNGLMPQTFQYKILKEAHEKAIEDHFDATTDDVRLVHRLGLPVKIVEGSYVNKKLTTKEDVHFFEKYFAEQLDAYEEKQYENQRLESYTAHKAL